MIKTYPNAEAVEWVDKIDDGWFKDKDEFVHEFYHYQTSLNSTIASEFDNFLNLLLILFFFSVLYL